MKSVLLIAFLAAALVAYFLKPAHQSFVISDPQDEFSVLDFQPSRDPNFAERIITSNLAVVLLRSDISTANAVALGAVRDWAKEKLSDDPEFLRPVSIHSPEQHNDVFSAFLHNLFGLERFWVEEQVAGGLRDRVQKYQQSDSYQLFRIDFYELFGVDSESALLLSRYQEDRARVSIGILTTALSILAVLVIGFVVRMLERFSAVSNERFWLSYCWLTAGAFYLHSSWSSNSIAALVASVICAFVGVAIASPERLSSVLGGPLRSSGFELTTKHLAVLTFVSLTLVSIQLLTWIRSGSLIQPDPVTLLVSAVTGDFLHDPHELKRSISQLLGLGILALLARTLVIYRLGPKKTPEFEKELRTLENISIS